MGLRERKEGTVARTWGDRPATGGHSIPQRPAKSGELTPNLSALLEILLILSEARDPVETHTVTLLGHRAD